MTASDVGGSVSLLLAWASFQTRRKGFYKVLTKGLRRCLEGILTMAHRVDLYMKYLNICVADADSKTEFECLSEVAFFARRLGVRESHRFYRACPWTQ